MWWVVSVAYAVSPGWLRDGADAVTVTAGQVDAPLYRGPTTRYLPAIAVQVRVEGEQRPALAVLDVAGTWNRISPEVASTLGIGVEWTKLSGEWVRTATIAHLQVGEVGVDGVRLEVDPEAPGLVLGISTLPELAVAILPSEGVVRFVPARQGPALVRSIGTPVDASHQPIGKYRTAVGAAHGDGLTLRVPGALRWGAVEVAGTVHLRTDLEVSKVAPSRRLPDPVMRGGLPYHNVGTKLGDVELADTWIQQDSTIGDPSADFAGALGYDVLFPLDIAVAPADGLISFRQASAVQSHDATPVAVDFAKQRYAQEETRYKGTANQTLDPTDPKVQISFDGPKRSEVPLGDPGNPKVRDRNLDLAETLWWAGELDDAIPYYLAASRYAGDDCGAHLLLGERRLAWAGVQLLDGTVGRLVIDPIERAGQLWGTWIALDPDTRAAITAGRDVPKGTLQSWQPDACRVSYGLLSAVERARGDTKAAEAVEAAHMEGHPAVAFARALAALSEGRFGAADPMLVAVQDSHAADPADLSVAIAKAKAGLGDDGPVDQAATELPGAVTDHPLTIALGMLEAARLTGHPEAVMRRVVRADQRWVPGQLAFALAAASAPMAWDETLEQRYPGSPQIACQKAVWLALNGKLREAQYLLRLERWPGFADWWTATAVVAWANKDEVGMKEALNNLTLRFPLLPVGDLGLPAL